MTLWVTTNDSGELVLDHDFSGSRETIIEDTGGSTTWGFDSSYGVPERTHDLVRQWVKDALSGNSPATGDVLEVLIDHQTKNVVDDR